MFFARDNRKTASEIKDSDDNSGTDRQMKIPTD
jgi:hypothetical protein